MCGRRRFETLPLGLAFAALCASGAQAEPLDDARRADLENLLRQDCGSCHGLTLKGGLGPPLLPATIGAVPEELLIEAILDGRPGTPMAPWRPLLSEAEAAWLVELMKRGEQP